MPCESYKNYLEAYCDDVLPLEVSQKVEAHLDSCDDCRKSVRDYQSLNVLLNSYVEQRVPEERFIAMRENILQRITAEDRSAVLAEGRKRPIHLSRLAGPGFSRRVLTFLSPLWNTGLRRAAVAVTCIVVLAFTLKARPEMRRLYRLPPVLRRRLLPVILNRPNLILNRPNLIPN